MNKSEVSFVKDPDKKYRDAVPPTAEAKVDKQKLQILFAKNSDEMDKYIECGHMPVFGYPLVCYSPTNKD